MTIISHRSSSPIACAILSLFAACSSPNAYRANRMVLEAADKQMTAGQFDAAVNSLEQMIVSTSATPEQYALQRYYAACLLVRARIEASLRTSNDWLRPTVASSYYMNFAEEWSKTATSAPKTSEDGEAMLPESLAAGGIERTRSYLDLTWLILCGRTGFQDEIGDVIQGEAKLANVAAAEQLGQSSGLSDRMMPWMMWSLFEYQRLRNEPLAYTFGVRARELGRKVPDSFPTARCDQIVGWIQNDSKFVFKSNAGIPFDPGAEVCSQTGEPNIRFHAEPKK